MKSIITALAASLLLTSCENTTVKGPTILQSAIAKPMGVSPSTKLPDFIALEEDIVSIGTDFVVAGGNGVIKERVLHFSTVYEYLRDDKLEAKGETELLAWGTNIIVSDVSGKRIGSIEKEKLASMFSINSIYSIKNAAGDVIAKSRKLDFLETSIDIYNMDGQVVATIKRPMFNVLSDRWTIQVSSLNPVDKRLLLMIPCFKSNKDNDKTEDTNNKKTK